MAYTESEARKLVLEAGLELVRKGLIARTWGNISARISETECIITPSGRTYDSLKPEELVKLNINDLSYPGNIKPSSEKSLHAKVYQLRPDVDFVIHTHQYYASIVGLEGRGYPYAAATEYGTPGTAELGDNVAKAVALNPEQKNFFMTMHGSLSLGTDMADAFKQAEILEDACRKRVEENMPDVNLRAVEPDEVFIKSVCSEACKAYGMQKSIFVSDPYVVERSRIKRALEPRIDDFAMICGEDVKCVEKSLKEAVSSLKERSAVLIENMGAVCVGNCEDDLSAIAMILAKNCACDLFASVVPGCGKVGKQEAESQRRAYIDSYSKQKTQNV
ncbi:MAG: class II aldolase/adducin family protein [Clostridia bacterium]|nr:class II aldolase/adducin family protein [Clostridia bacterium]